MKALVLNLCTYESRNDGEGGGRSPSVLRLRLASRVPSYSSAEHVEHGCNCVQTDRKREGGREGWREGARQTDRHRHR
jgi:hypothetical protein